MQNYYSPTTCTKPSVFCFLLYWYCIEWGFVLTLCLLSYIFLGKIFLSINDFMWLFLVCRDLIQVEYFISHMPGTRGVSDFGIFAYPQWNVLGMVYKSKHDFYLYLIHIGSRYFYKIFLFTYLLFVVLGFELKALCLLGRGSITWAMHLPHYIIFLVCWHFDYSMSAEIRYEFSTCGIMVMFKKFWIL
jgi:hypothetical protein